MLRRRTTFSSWSTPCTVNTALDVSRPSRLSFMWTVLLGSDVDNQTLAQDAAGPSTPTVMAVAPQQDLHTRPVVAQRRDQAAQPEHDLSPGRPGGGAQEGGDHAALAVEHHDRLEAVLIIVRVEQAKLLATVHGVEGVVDVEHDAARHPAEALAVVVDQGTAHAQQGVPVRQVLGPRHSGLRTQVAMLRQPIHRQLEQRISPQTVGVVAVLVAGGDHQHAEADDLIEPVHDALGRPRVTDARGKTPGDPQPLLDLPQDQQATIGRHQLAVEARLDRPTADCDRPGKIGLAWSLAGMRRPDRCGLVSTPKSYIRSEVCTRAR